MPRLNSTSSPCRSPCPTAAAAWVAEDGFDRKPRTCPVRGSRRIAIARSVSAFVIPADHLPRVFLDRKSALRSPGSGRSVRRRSGRSERLVWKRRLNGAMLSRGAHRKPCGHADTAQSPQANATLNNSRSCAILGRQIGRFRRYCGDRAGVCPRAGRPRPAGRVSRRRAGRGRSSCARSLAPCGLP